MRRCLRVWTVAGLLVVAVAVARAGPLRSPWDNVKVAQTDAAYACPAPPSFVKVLDPGTYYIDKNASVIDPQKLAAYQSVTEAPTHLGQFAGLAADAYLANGSRAAAA